VRPKAERRHLASRIPELRALVPALRDLALQRRAVPLLYLEITGLDSLRPTARRAALRACKRAVATALAASAGSVLRRGDVVAAGPNAAWFAALLVGRAIALTRRPVTPDADLVVAATRLRQAVLVAFRDEAARGSIPVRAGVRAGWTVVEPVDSGSVLSELRHAVRGAAIVARIEERRAAFLASVTHELRTPLTAIIGYAERLQSVRKSTASRTRHDLAVIESEGRRLARLVEGLIDAGAWGAGSLRLRTEPASIGALADEAWASVALRHAARMVKYVRHGDATAAVDRERSLQIFVNLLDNAAQHARAQVSVSIARRAGKIRISVEDDGPGFAPDTIRDFARPFAVGPLGHLGLGLSIARLLVEAHGGTLRAATRRNGGGACVIATFPIRDP
jgi:signal transduction histidine kinase